MTTRWAFLWAAVGCGIGMLAFGPIRTHWPVATPLLTVLIVVAVAALGMRHFLRAKSYSWAFVLLAPNCGIMMLAFAFLYWHAGLISPNGEVVHDGEAALYFSIVTWTTLGYGDYHPAGAVRYLAASEALLGYTFMGLLVAVTYGWLNEHHQKPA